MGVVDEMANDPGGVCPVVVYTDGLRRRLCVCQAATVLF
jgi:hypothetical protein